MTRVAIAGTGGLAYWIAHFLSTETFHPFILLSRAPKPLLTAKGWQVAVVNYTDPSDLQYKLAGVDTVISTVTGSPQIGLIDAAAAVGVKRFAPAEFEGQPSLRPQADPLDRGKLAALARLQHYSAYGMQFTSFVCGILYDRFSPGGMAASGIGIGSGVAAEGDYVMDIRNLKAQIPRYNAAGQPVRICMTSAHDIGRFVVAAIDLDEWPRELRMRGERLTVLEVVAIAEQMRGRNFEHEEYDHVEQTLPWRLHYAEMAHNVKQKRQAQTLIATMDGRYDFASANLNSLVNFQPLRFRDWLQVAWQGQI
ncbi:MAG: hypothetical protein FRX48_09321 [Lasallia pustulata]|uniref:NmrA-like domain-containing protein n=1 Tax=Lasallia pustulata TaxID=136370 RepID=A0A5M8PCM3_9LECA|nr:MAG: hypothetical protein FRX48_09321 [Lasallia pustulata]